MVVAADGEVVGRGSVALSSVREGERHEQDPRAWWRAVAAASREALREVAPERVRGVAVCATSGTVLLVDGSGVPLTPGVMYDDARAGGGAHPALRKLRWMLDAWPELARGARLAHQADVVTRALVGGEVPSDSSHALKSGYDPEREAWLAPGSARGAPAEEAAPAGGSREGALPEEVAPDGGSREGALPEEVAPDGGLPEGALSGEVAPDGGPPQAALPEGLLPAVVRSGTRLGEVCAAAAVETSIPAGTPVIAGMTDGCAAQLAAGALRAGDWNSVLGTTLVLKGYSSTIVRDPAGVLYSHRAPDGGWLPGGASSTGAGVLSARFAGRDLDELGRRAQGFEGTPVVAFPLVARGERFPFAAPDAEGFVLGEPREEAELFASLLQGVAFVERLCFDYVDLLGAPTGGRLTLTGGATASRYWCQLRADVLGRPVRLVEQSEAAFGMALLAASGGCDVVEAAAAMVRTREVIEPRPGAAFTPRYLRLVGELERRGWLGQALAAHARARA